MKKAIFKILLAGALVTFMSTSAFADADVSWTAADAGSISIADSATGGSTTLVRLSPSVQAMYLDDGATGNAYSAGARNSKGNKTYGVNSIFTGIKMTDGITTDIPSAATGFATSTWATVGQ